MTRHPTEEKAILETAYNSPKMRTAMLSTGAGMVNTDDHGGEKDGVEQVGAEDGRGITVEASGCGLRGDFVPSWPFSLIELNLNFSDVSSYPK